MATTSAQLPSGSTAVTNTGPRRVLRKRNSLPTALRPITPNLQNLSQTTAKNVLQPTKTHSKTASNKVQAADKENLPNIAQPLSKSRGKSLLPLGAHKSNSKLPKPQSTLKRIKSALMPAVPSGATISTTIQFEDCFDFNPTLDDSEQQPSVAATNPTSPEPLPPFTVPAINIHDLHISPARPLHLTDSPLAEERRQLNEERRELERDRSLFKQIMDKSNEERTLAYAQIDELTQRLEEDRRMLNLERESLVEELVQAQQQREQLAEISQRLEEERLMLELQRMQLDQHKAFIYNRFHGLLDKLSSS